MFPWCKQRADVDVQDSVADNAGCPRRAQSDTGGNGGRIPFWGRGVSHSGTSSSSAVPRPPKESKPENGRRLGSRIMPLLTNEKSVTGASSSNGAHVPRNYKGAELEKLGFKVYSAADMGDRFHSVQPVAFLGIETEADPLAGISGSSSWTQQARVISQQLNKLVPVHVNACMKRCFGIASPKEYAPVIRKLLKRDPLLTFALQKALRYLKIAQQISVNHVTPDPSGQTSSLFGMRISPCVWKEERLGQLQVALMIEHNVPYNPAEVMPRLMRDYAVLSHVPAILTMIDFQGKVLYQNASSLAYMGDLLSTKHERLTTEGLLNVLFEFEDKKLLENLLSDVLSGKEFQEIVQVPSSLRRFLAESAYTATTVSETVFGTEDEKVGQLPGNAKTNGGKQLTDELEVQFQIGNSFTTRGVAGVHNKGPQGKGLSSFIMPSKASATQPSIPGAMGDLSFTLQDVYGNGSIQMSGPSDLVPQNRLMSILDRAPNLQLQQLRTEQPSQVHTKKNAGVRFDQPSEAPSSTGSLPDVDNAPQYREHGENRGSNQENCNYDEACFHEIHAIPLLDPVLDKQVIMLLQTDVTDRVHMENRLADLTEAQLKMLEHLFPRHVIEYLLAGVHTKGSASALKEVANTHEQVMVLFCDVVGFTSMSKEVEPNQVLHFLNELYEVFDEWLDYFDLYKLDIVGDCYIAVAGLIKQDKDGFVCLDETDEDQITANAVKIMQFAKTVLRESKRILMPHNSEPVKIRIGIHAGKLVSGLIGSKMPKFTLFGDTMNTASRMESTCRPGCVHVSDTFGAMLPHEDWEPTGGVEVKGKGLMQTSLWVPNSERPESQAELPEHQSFHSDASRPFSEIGKSQRGTFAGYNDNDPEFDGMHSSNALMAILQNIQDDGLQSIGPGSLGGAGAKTVRPRSAYIRARSRPSARSLNDSELPRSMKSRRSSGASHCGMESDGAPSPHTTSPGNPGMRTSAVRMSAEDPAVRRSAMRHRAKSGHTSTVVKSLRLPGSPTKAEQEEPTHEANQIMPSHSE